LNNYAILAHGIKSAAQYVGAENLAKYAQNHEELGKQKAYQEISYSIQDFLNEIQRLRSELQIFFDKINSEKDIEEANLGEISREEILDQIHEIIKEEQWYQPEALNKRIENLLKNKLDGKVRELFRSSMELADDYEYAQVADTLEKIKGLLSKEVPEMKVQ
jgi:HPt (histidine-containing phosphotransfer) domain-containing protein